MHDLPDSHHGERLVELTPVVTVVLVRATTLPTKLVVVPRVAELPTCQYTWQFWPPLITFTMAALAEVKVLPI
jgi:hypothetical protein